MPTNELIENLLFPFILSNAVFLGILFFTIKSDNRKANIYLGLFIWSIAIQIYSDLLWELPIEEDLNVPLFLLEPFLFHLLFLVFYLYKTINKRIKKWYYLLFLPGIFHNVLLHFDSLFLSEIGMTIYESFFYLLEVAFLVYAFRILQKHEKEITDFYSDLEHKSLSWLKRLFILIISIHALLILSGIFEILEVNGAITEDGIRFSYLGIVIFILYWIGYNGFSQPEIFKERLFLAPNVDESIEQVDLIKTEEIVEQESTTSEKDFQKFDQIKEQIQNQELYTNPKLNLRSLAEAVELNEKELSRLINECGKVNFYQFINEYRIEKFKKLIQSPEAHQFTLLGLAAEAGFSSKSTFYAAFKKLEGMTPKQYQDSLKKSE
jgi:AraC-like DNA-binding protein